jgi:hypothetical protein
MDLLIGERRTLTARLGVQEELVREELGVERKVRFCSFFSFEIDE